MEWPGTALISILGFGICHTTIVTIRARKALLEKAKAKARGEKPEEKPVWDVVKELVLFKRN